MRGLLQFPRQVRAEPRSDAQRGVDEPCRLRVPDDRVRDGAQGTRQWQRQAVEEPVHHIESDYMADARAVGGRPHHQVAAEGHAQRGSAVNAEIVQHRIGRTLPFWFKGHARQGRLPLAGPVEGDDVEWAGREVGREVNDLLGVPVEAVHHDERARGALGGFRSVRWIGLPAHRGEFPAAIGDCVPGDRKAIVGLVEACRHGVDEAPLTGVVDPEVKGGEFVEAPRGIRVPLG